MRARIYLPAKTAMQSGAARTRAWVLEYMPEQPLYLDPLMKWTGARDMRRQVKLFFATDKEAQDYACLHHIPYRLYKPQTAAFKPKSYADNFSR